MKTWQEVIVQTEEAFQEMLRYLEVFPYLVVDLETSGLDVLSHKIVGIGLCGDETKGFYIPTGHLTGEQQLPEKWVLERLRPLLEGKPMVAHNLKFEFSIFRMHEITLRLGFDTMLADYLLDVDAEHGLKEIAGRVLGAENWATKHVEHLEDRPVAEVAPYCIEDVIRTRQLLEHFEPKIKGDSEFRRLYYDTANATHPASMAALLALVSASQVVFGTDYPYVATGPQVAALGRLGLAGEQLHAITSGNAMSLVPRLKA
jgi:DNA polymerase I-like protein with 3'-5' exonuclease and polymerase domains